MNAGNVERYIRMTLYLEVGDNMGCDECGKKEALIPVFNEKYKYLCQDCWIKAGKP